MSTWRDIWRYGVIANRLFAESEERGEKAFDKLMEVYDRPEKDGKSRQDGMIRYIKAEAYERKYWETNKEEYREKALKNYKSAENLFPVEHWKEKAIDSFERLEKRIKIQDYYNIQIKREKIKRLNSEEDIPVKINANFDDLLWYGFQKVYTFVHLNDFGRYVCLSSLSRGSSEWPLSLIDFRTVLELEIKQCFPDVIKKNSKGEPKFRLEDAIIHLGHDRQITKEEKFAFDNIRMAGNKATHDPGVLDPEFKTLNVVSFIDVLKYFDNYRRKSTLKFNTTEIPSPLRQITLEEFQDQLDKEKLVLMGNNYYN